MSSYTTAGLMMIAVGLFEIFVTPAILKRIWGQRPLPHSRYLFRMVRMSGWIVVGLGLFFLIAL